MLVRTKSSCTYLFVVSRFFYTGLKPMHCWARHHLRHHCLEEEAHQSGIAQRMLPVVNLSRCCKCNRCNRCRLPRRVQVISTCCRGSRIFCRLSAESSVERQFRAACKALSRFSKKSLARSWVTKSRHHFFVCDCRG